MLGRKRSSIGVFAVTFPGKANVSTSRIRDAGEAGTGGYAKAMTTPTRPPKDPTSVKGPYAPEDRVLAAPLFRRQAGETILQESSSAFQPTYKCFGPHVRPGPVPRIARHGKRFPTATTAVGPFKNSSRILPDAQNEATCFRRCGNRRSSRDRRWRLPVILPARAC